MGKRNEERKRSVWSNVLITAAALIVSWATIELAFKPHLAAGRAAIKRELDPDYDPDDDLEDTALPPNDKTEDSLQKLK